MYKKKCQEHGDEERRDLQRSYSLHLDVRVLARARDINDLHMNVPRRIRGRVLLHFEARINVYNGVHGPVGFGYRLKLKLNKRLTEL